MNFGVSANTGRIILSAILLLACFSCQRTPDRHIFTYAQEQPAGSLRAESMEFFKKELHQRSNGRIKVELFFGGVLGSERELSGCFPLHDQSRVQGCAMVGEFWYRLSAT